MERCREGTGKDIDGEGLGEVYTEGDRERYRRRGSGRGIKGRQGKI